MGIKTKIVKNDLPLKYQNYSLIESDTGVSDSVYLLGDKFVIKIYENSLFSSQEEITLLNSLKSLQVVEFIECLKIDKKEAIVYNLIQGTYIKDPNLQHIKQVAKFLKEFHSLTIDKKSNNPMKFTQKRVEEIIKHHTNVTIQNYFKLIDIDLNNDGIIHGDLFRDNIYFLDDKLSGVLDFTEACNGDFLLDLAIVGISWCFDEDVLNNKKLNVLIENYDKSIQREIIISYMRYAFVCYGTFRFINGGNYQEMFKKLESIL